MWLESPLERVFHLMNYKTLTANQNPRNLTSSFVNKPNAIGSWCERDINASFGLDISG